MRRFTVPNLFSKMNRFSQTFTTSKLGGRWRSILEVRNKKKNIGKKKGKYWHECNGYHSRVTQLLVNTSSNTTSRTTPVLLPHTDTITPNQCTKKGAMAWHLFFPNTVAPRVPFETEESPSHEFMIFIGDALSEMTFR